MSISESQAQYFGNFVFDSHFLQLWLMFLKIVFAFTNKYLLEKLINFCACVTSPDQEVLPFSNDICHGGGNWICREKYDV